MGGLYLEPGQNWWEVPDDAEQPPASSGIPTMGLPAGGMTPVAGSRAGMAGYADYLRAQREQVPAPEQDGGIGTLFGMGARQIPAMGAAAGEWLAGQFSDTAGKPAAQQDWAGSLAAWMGEARQSWENSIAEQAKTLAPGYQEGRQKEWTTTDLDKAAWADPQAILAQFVESLPLSLLSMVPGGIVMRGGGAALKGALVMGGVEGAMGVAETAQNIASEISHADERELMDSPYYAQLRQQGASDQDARQALIAQTQGLLKPVAGGLWSAAAGGAGGYGLGKLIDDEIGRGIVRRFGAGFAREAPTEALQGGGTQYLSGAAAQENWDPNRDVWRQTLESGVQEGAIGGLSGGGFGVVLGKRPGERAGAGTGETDLTGSNVGTDQDAAAAAVRATAPQQLGLPGMGYAGAPLNVSMPAPQPQGRGYGIAPGPQMNLPGFESEQDALRQYEIDRASEPYPGYRDAAVGREAEIGQAWSQQLQQENAREAANRPVADQDLLAQGRARQNAIDQQWPQYLNAQEAAGRDVVDEDMLAADERRQDYINQFWPQRENAIEAAQRQVTDPQLLAMSRLRQDRINAEQSAYAAALQARQAARQPEQGQLGLPLMSAQYPEAGSQLAVGTPRPTSRYDAEQVADAIQAAEQRKRQQTLPGVESEREFQQRLLAQERALDRQRTGAPAEQPGLPFDFAEGDQYAAQRGQQSNEVLERAGVEDIYTQKFPEDKLRRGLERAKPFAEDSAGPVELPNAKDANQAYYDLYNLKQRGTSPQLQKLSPLEFARQPGILSTLSKSIQALVQRVSSQEELDQMLGLARLGEHPLRQRIYRDIAPGGEAEFSRRHQPHPFTGSDAVIRLLRQFGRGEIDRRKFNDEIRKARRAWRAGERNDVIDREQPQTARGTVGSTRHNVHAEQYAVDRPDVSKGAKAIEKAVGTELSTSVRKALRDFIAGTIDRKQLNTALQEARRTPADRLLKDFNDGKLDRRELERGLHDLQTSDVEKKLRDFATGKIDRRQLEFYLKYGRFTETERAQRYIRSKRPGDRIAEGYSRRWTKELLMDLLSRFKQDENGQLVYVEPAQSELPKAKWREVPREKFAKVSAEQAQAPEQLEMFEEEKARETGKRKLRSEYELEKRRGKWQEKQRRREAAKAEEEKRYAANQRAEALSRSKHLTLERLAAQAEGMSDAELENAVTDYMARDKSLAAQLEQRPVETNAATGRETLLGSRSLSLLGSIFNDIKTRLPITERGLLAKLRSQVKELRNTSNPSLTGKIFKALSSTAIARAGVPLKDLKFYQAGLDINGNPIYVDERSHLLELATMQSMLVRKGTAELGRFLQLANQLKGEKGLAERRARKRYLGEIERLFDYFRNELGIDLRDKSINGALESFESELSRQRRIASETSHLDDTAESPEGKRTVDTEAETEEDIVAAATEDLLAEMPESPDDADDVDTYDVVDGASIRDAADLESMQDIEEEADRQQDEFLAQLEKSQFNHNKVVRTAWTQRQRDARAETDREDRARELKRAKKRAAQFEKAITPEETQELLREVRKIAAERGLDEEWVVQEYEKRLLAKTQMRYFQKAPASIEEARHRVAQRARYEEFQRLAHQTRVGGSIISTLDRMVAFMVENELPGGRRMNNVLQKVRSGDITRKEAVERATALLDDAELGIGQAAQNLMFKPYEPIVLEEATDYEKHLVKQQQKEAADVAKQAITEVMNETADITEAEAEQAPDTAAPSKRVDSGSAVRDGNARVDTSTGSTRGTLPRLRNRAIRSPAEYSRGSFKPDVDQVEGANRILQHFIDNKERVFLLADGTGFGKTATMLMVADQFRKRNRMAKILVVHQGKQNVGNRQFREQAAKMGIETNGYTFVSYGSLSSVNKNSYDLVIFDEAHNLKNPGSNMSQNAQPLLNAKGNGKILFASATPTDTPAGMMIYARMLGLSSDEFLAKVGIEERTTKTGEVEYSPLAGDTVQAWLNVAKQLGQVLRDLARRGGLLQRDLPLMSQPKVEMVADKTHRNFRPKGFTYPGSLKDFETAINASNMASRAKIGYASAVAEVAKVPAVVDAVKKALASGRKVVVFVGRFNKAGMVVGINGATYKMPYAGDLLGKALSDAGIPFLQYTESTERGALDEFNKKGGKYSVVITTFQKGGAAVDMHDNALKDKSDGMPRTLIMTELPWSGSDLVQAVGRVDRRGTVNTPEIKIFSSDTFSSDRSRRHVQRRKQLVLLQTGTERTVSVPPGRDDAPYVYKQNGKLWEVKFNDVPREVLAKITPALAKLGGKYDKQLKKWAFPIDTWEQKHVARVIDSIYNEETDLVLPRRAPLQATTSPYAGTRQRLAKQFLAKPPATLSEARRMLLEGLHTNDPLRALAMTLPDLSTPIQMATKPLAGGEFGLFNGTNIVLDPSMPAAELALTVLHEGFHAATRDGINSNPELKARAEAILAAFRAAAPSVADNFHITSIHELVAEAFSNPEVRAALQQLGPTKRTLWARFVDLVRRALHLPARTATMLDEVLSIGHKASGTSQNVRTLAAKTWVSDKLRTLAGLPMMTKLQMVESYQQLFETARGNILKRWSDLMETRDAAIRHRQSLGAALHREWDNFKTAYPELEATMSGLMGKATTYAIDPSVDFDDLENLHLRYDAAGNPLDPQIVKDNRANYDMLRKEFEAMVATGPIEGPLAGDLFQKVANHYRQLWSDNINAVVDSVAYSFRDSLPGLTAAKINRAANTGDIKKTVDAEVKRQTNATQRRELAGEISANESRKLQRSFVSAGEEITDTLNELFARRHVLGVYFPLRRFGDYVVEAFDAWSKAGGYKTLHDAMEARGSLLRVDPSLQFSRIEQDDNGRYEFQYRNREVHFAETRSEAQSIRDELVGKYRDVSNVTKKREYMEGNAISSELVSRMEKRIDDPRLRMALRATYLEMLPETSIQKSRLNRKRVEGYSRNMSRAFASSVMSSSYYLSQVEHGLKIADAMGELLAYEKDQAFTAGRSDDEIATLHDVVAEIKKRDTLDSRYLDTAEAMQLATSAGYLWYLATPSYSIINASQPLLLTYPWLSSRYGMSKAAKAMTRAYRSIMPEALRRGLKGVTTLRNTDRAELFEFLKPGANSVGDALRLRIENNPAYQNQRGQNILKMLGTLGESGTIDMSLAASTRAEAQGSTMAYRGVEAVSEWMRLWPHITEVMNRTVTAVAAYELAVDAGATHTEAVEAARHAVNTTQFNYNASNKPRYFSERQFQLARPIFMFKQHAQHMYYMLLQGMARSSSALMKRMRGEAMTEAEKAEAKQALGTVGGVLLSHALAAGVVGAMFEPIKWALGAALWAFGDDDEPWDMEVDTHRALVEMFGETAGGAMARGIPYALGIDLTSRVGINNLLTFGGGQNEAGREWVETKAFELLGPLGSVVANAAEGVKDINEGAVMRGVERMVPKLARDLVRTARLGTEGIVDSSGRIMKDSNQFGPGDLFAASMGFSPSDYSDYYLKSRAIKDVEAFYTGRRNTLIERFRRTDAEDRSGIFEAIREYNQAAPESMRLTYAQLLRNMKATRKTESMAAAYGVGLPKSRRDLLKFGEFVE